MWITTDDLIKIGLALLLGGLIGAEREYRDKAAGFRTIILITLGSTLFTMLSIKLAGPANDPMRVAANILTGIGFIGAGAILRGERGVIGLTTAAIIWLSAALGLGIGGGEYVLSVVVTGFVYTVLWLFPFFEKYIDQSRHMHVYTITIAYSDEIFDYLENILFESGLKLVAAKRTKVSGKLTCHWTMAGPPRVHEHLIEMLLADPLILEFEY
jgi:putative Mg2+ transporter-C (MgtC) family protein